jgi:Ca2+/Na+ antiporter
MKAELVQSEALEEIRLYSSAKVTRSGFCVRQIPVGQPGDAVVRWGVREDVAGATFMAFGSAAPEIIINAIGTFTGESDLGVGAIIGSGMIAFSCILGLCALVSGADLMLKRRPLARDSLFYLLALSLLTLFFSDVFITVGEAVVLFSLYICYVGLVFASPYIRRYLQKRKRQQQYEAAVKEAMERGADRAALEELKTHYLTVATKKSFVEQAAVREVAARKPGTGQTINGSRSGGRANNDLSNSLLGDGPVASEVDLALQHLRHTRLQRLHRRLRGGGGRLRD